MKWLLNFKKETCTRRNLKQAKPHKLKASRNLELSPLFFFLLIFLSLMQVGLSIPFKRNEYAFLRMIQSQLNEITIKIEGTGEQQILGGNYSFCPNSITLNGNPVTINSANCSLINIPTGGSETNTVKMTWNDKLYSLHGMFENLTNIVEVDLSKFDSSLVQHMTQMFWNCISLTSINFENFNTSLVEDMHLLFGSCENMTEFDLSSFDTSRVRTMYFMFASCAKVTSLNLAHFNTSNVETMEAMFYETWALESLDISNFDTSKVYHILKLQMSKLWNICSIFVLI